ncbi:hypothetical protein L1D14_10785 [Vibrio tubiashii]|uniref:hypothetical protein n=1 Tax=Vibrio tubiashii TaxID=29498 RepID=UPI001EFCD89B|nr:hypothetical protein [Vibrio tubiashii]MCG9576724.1 hypothetical protein [Vibrio tubiashii]
MKDKKTLLKAIITKEDLHQLTSMLVNSNYEDFVKSDTPPNLAMQCRSVRDRYNRATKKIHKLVHGRKLIEYFGIDTKSSMAGINYLMANCCADAFTSVALYQTYFGLPISRNSTRFNDWKLERKSNLIFWELAKAHTSITDTALTTNEIEGALQSSVLDINSRFCGHKKSAVKRLIKSKVSLVDMQRIVKRFPLLPLNELVARKPLYLHEVYFLALEHYPGAFADIPYGAYVTPPIRLTGQEKRTA